MDRLTDNLYSGSGFSEWEIGDVTMIFHKEVYHLFHLIIPNHDYIAHAVSKDGITWRRVKNALFVGDPGDWDDDMLWTMQVYESDNRFEMYYTGLQRKDRGVVSKIGLAVSENLFDWEKVNDEVFPFGPRAPHYETYENNPRLWMSFRDPFRYDYEGKTFFLVCTRSASGPVSRRGCVGLVQLMDKELIFHPPLHFPRMYDDVECPCVFELNGMHYLLGSIREDIKVRYWFAPEFMGEYHCFHNNVLLPQGNYAARVQQDGDYLLIYNFFYANGNVNALRIFPPPKQLETDERGRLVLKSYYRWDQMVIQTLTQSEMGSIIQLFKNPTASFEQAADKWTCGSRSGYEVFVIQKAAPCFIWEGILAVEGMGKLGLVTDIDEEGSGYYYSFDVINSVVHLQSWGFNAANTRSNFVYNVLQDNIFHLKEEKEFHFRLIRYGNYIELAIDGIVKLSLIDYTYFGNGIGLYSASSTISLRSATLKNLPVPESEYSSDH